MYFELLVLLGHSRVHGQQKEDGIFYSSKLSGNNSHEIEEKPTARKGIGPSIYWVVPQWLWTPGEIGIYLNKYSVTYVYL